MKNAALRVRFDRLGVLLAAGLAASAWGASRPQLHAASERYSAKGASAATGRSGSAQLEFRALTGRSGVTHVEVTTGELDSSAAAPGQLSAVQLKVFDSAGGLQSVRQFRHLSSGGHVDLTFNDLSRGQKLQAQANVRGIDGARTDVVTVDTTVLLRPDLAVASVSAPDKAYVKTPVNLSAVVSERNGDVGAHADCVLSIDGTEADRATGIWVDASSSVSCAFTHIFDNVGTHTVKIGVDKVVPTDDDPSNDSATASIEIIDQGNFRYRASVSRTDFSSSWQTSVQLTGDDGTTTRNNQSGSSSSNSGTVVQSQFYGQLDRAMSFPISLDVVEVSDGSQVGAGHFDSITSDYSYSMGDGTIACASRYDQDSNGYAFVCSHTSLSAPTTQVTWTRYAGSVTYFSSSFANQWWKDDASGQTGSSQWAYNYGGQNDFGGTPWTVGSRYAFDVKLYNDADSAHVNPEFDTATTSSGYSHPKACSSYQSGAFTQTVCTESSSSTTRTQGYATNIQ